MFYKGTSGAIVVADITDPESIENAEQWKRLINENIANQAYVAKM
jgi:GTPase SAR1 family protein